MIDTPELRQADREWFRVAILSAIMWLLATASVAAATCENETLINAELKARWFNPHGEADDVVIPLPGGGQMAFAAVGVPGPGLYGDESSVVRFGASVPRIYETQLNGRISSSITIDGHPSLIIGKYEVSYAQYVYTVGEGNLERGLRVLQEASEDPGVQELLRGYFEPPCQGVLTKPLANLLSLPASFLKYRDYTAFIDRLNEFCLADEGCQKEMAVVGGGAIYPPFIRLPSELEWEYVARGGGPYARGEMSRQQFENDTPTLPAGKALTDFAHFNSDPGRLLPIGSREPLNGLYDVFGNVRELMGSPFTSENGFGAVGAYSARGGSFQTTANDYRVSFREELPISRYDDDRKEYVLQYFPYTGLRLAIGLPIAARDTAEVRQSEFDSNYRPIDQLGDGAGNTTFDARTLGRFAERTVTLPADRIDDADLDDYFALEVGALVDFKGDFVADGDAFFELTSEDGTVLARLPDGPVADTGDGKRSLQARSLLPGRYYLHVGRTGGSGTISYSGTLATSPVADTGYDRLVDAEAFTPVGADPFAASGYVGAGDLHDYYGIELDSRDAGVSVTVSGATMPVTVDVLDEDGRALGSSIVAPDDPVPLKVPFRYRARGFVHIYADVGRSSAYEMTVAAGEVTDKEFGALGPGAASLPAMEPGKVYAGVLNTLQGQLVGTFQLDRAKRVRVDLTGLSADVNLSILDSNGEPVASPHQRTGEEDETFEESLSSGQYFVVMNLVDIRRSVSSFQVVVSTTDPSGGAAISVAELRNAAAPLPASSVVSSTRDSLDGLVPLRYYALTVKSRGTIATVLSGFSPESDLNLTLEDKAGVPVRRSANLGGQDENIEMVVEPGDYFLRVDSSGPDANTPYVLKVRVGTALQDPEFPETWKSVQKVGAWRLYRDGDTCAMASIATVVAPKENWLLERPVFLISVQKGSSSAAIDFGNAGVFRPNAFSELSASVQSKSGWRDIHIAATADDPWIKPVSAGTAYIDTVSIAQIAEGSKLKVSGPLPRGAPGSYEFQLDGYAKAAKQIVQLCGSTAEWIAG